MSDKSKSRKTWREKLEGKHTSHGKIVKILIPKPLDVNDIMSDVPKGKLITLRQIMEKLARDYSADKTCAKVTGIFVHIASEAAEEDLKEGRKGKDEITPYWRTIKNDGSLNPRFPGGVEAQAKELRKEGFGIEKSSKLPKVKDFEKYLVRL